MSETVDVYPYPVTKSQPNPLHSISNGSYGQAFIVVAAVVVVAILACIIGRKRNGKGSQEKEVGGDQNSHQVHQQPPPPPPQPKANGGAEQHGQMGPREWEGAKVDPRIALRERGDIEHGFGRGIPPPPRFDGGWRPEVRFSDNV